MFCIQKEKRLSGISMREGEERERESADCTYRAGFSVSDKQGWTVYD